MDGLLLIIVALILIIAEAHLPSFGALGIAGIALLLSGGNIIINQGGIFGIPLDWGFFLGIATTAAISLFLASYVVARNLKKKPIAGIEGMIGHEAKIIEWSDHSGRVQVQGELWAATSLHPQNFSVGETVIVGGIKDLSLHIHKKP